MSALNIPGIGERLGERYIRKIDVGFAGETGIDVALSTATGDNTIVNINEANVFVHSLKKQQRVPFTAGATFKIIVGDGSDSDGYWTDTLYLTTTCDAVFVEAGTTAAYAQGKLYTTTDVIAVNQSEVVVTGGNVRFLIEYTRGMDTDLNPATSS